MASGGDKEPLVFAHVFTQENPGRIDDYFKLDKKALGEGSYGQVTRGLDKNTGAPRAIKAIDREKIPNKARFEDEVKIQQSLDHPHIVKLYEVFKDAKRYYLVMELCTGGELFDRIVEESERKGEGAAFDEADAAKIMQQIMGAIRYLHSREYAHRDIKPENFLLQNKEKDAPIKVIDFGLAKQFRPGKSELKTKAGTPYYVAPEVLLSSSTGGYNEKCDIWSCGVLAYIILCGYPPFYGDTDAQILRMVKKGVFEYPSPDWDNMSVEAKDFINQMLTFDPHKRPPAEAILEHKWLKNIQGNGKFKLSRDLGSKLKQFRGMGRLKKVALTLIAQQMREEEILELQRTFEGLDKNKDGTLTAQEIREAMQKHNLQIPPDLDETMSNLDTDGSGCIDYTEFIAATLTTKQYLKKEVLWAAFRVFDRDGSGEIDKKELKSVIKDAKESQIDAMIAEADVNGDGKISFDEFWQMMEREGSKAVKATS